MTTYTAASRARRSPSSAMKVLHLPLNIASQGSVTIRALRGLGVDARCLVLNNAAIQDPQGVEAYVIGSRRRHPVRGGLQTLAWWRAVLAGIKWADVVHWHSAPCGLPFDIDLKWVALLDKPRIVEFWGSDIRIPEIASADNPSTARMYREHPELADGMKERSLRTQKAFGSRGFDCLVGDADMESYVQKELFSRTHRSAARILLEEYTARYPDPSNDCPIIVHAPSVRALKGTEHILEAIDELKKKFRFRFQLIHGVPHAQAIRMMSNCDIMIDEIVSGAYGLTVIEAMAMGKPTICYIKPSLRPHYPSELPIVSACQDNLVRVLSDLLRDGAWRHQLGQQGRAYVEKYHDAQVVATTLLGIYEELLRGRQA